MLRIIADLDLLSNQVQAQGGAVSTDQGPSFSHLPDESGPRAL